ncbi:MAG: neutral/alkaline non-lysosomal ceramidase N-terminal domain-containing protein [Abditibacteriales bacterium]|nr:neutral/alkaline non-lysosomal ceramidase N-terminal domain-containing protein [Abditibacteriales bacterium]MDW8364323.1 neutral/alkaline non-lysosomal ceramidase N-terminal domain-containing protein [Abditibacteriales bacterium]
MIQLHAGVAKVNITPPIGTHLQGYVRGTPSVGVLDDLHARAMVFDNGETKVALIAADLIGLDEPSVKRIRRMVRATTGIAEGNVMIACSHTHCAQAMMNLCQWSDPPNLHTVLETERKLAGAVALAAQHLQPVKLAYGEGTMDYNINRRRPDLPGTPMLPNPDGVVDRRVKVLRVQAEGQSDPLAVIFLYACHATALSAIPFISSEHPGMACEFIERAYDGATTAFYLQGCAGDVRPNITNDEGRFRGGTPEEVKRLGRRLGAEVVRVCETLTGGDRPAAYSESGVLRVASKRVRLPLAQLPTAADLRRILRESQTAYERGWAQHVLNQLRNGKLPTHESAEVQALRVGDQLFIGLPGEPMTELGWRIEERLTPLSRSAGEGAEGRAFILGFANMNVGYLCTAASYAEGGYEPTTSYRAYTRPAPFTPQVERLIVNAAASVVQKTFDTA